MLGAGWQTARSCPLGFVALSLLLLLMGGRPTTAVGYATVPLPAASVREVPLEGIRGVTFGGDGTMWYDTGKDLVHLTSGGVSNHIELIYGSKFELEPGVMAWVEHVTAASDGGIWFTESAYPTFSGSLLGRIDPLGYISEYQMVGWESSGLVAGTDGSVWYTASTTQGGLYSRGIFRQRPHHEVEQLNIPNGDAPNLPTQSWPEALTTGSDASVWFVDYGSDAEGANLVGHVEASGRIVEYPLPGRLGLHPMIAGGTGEYVWIANPPHTLYRISDDGKVTPLEVPVPAGEFTALTTGAGGAAFYLAGKPEGPPALVRVTPSDEVTIFFPMGVSYWTDPARGPNGELWFAGRNAAFEVNPPEPPRNVEAPVVSGEAVAGSELSTSSGGWEGQTSVLYSWQRCDAAGAGCVAMPGQTGARLALREADVGASFRASVTAVGDGGTRIATSAPSPVVRPAPAPSVAVLGAVEELLPPVGATMHWQFGWSERGTKVRELQVLHLPAGAELVVHCRGGACPFQSRRLAPVERCRARPCVSSQGGAVDLAPLWIRRRLKPGAVITVAITRSGFRGKQFVYRVRRSGPPKEPAIDCLRAGSSSATERC